MTEYSSDDEDRRTGRSSSDLTPDDFDFDIANYTASASQNAFFSRPPESKKTERQRSKTDSRQGASSKAGKEAKMTPGSAGSAASGQNNSDVAKILCRICGDSAVRHVHYGGHCCFSCKAFFRRAVNWQNKNNRTFQCKFENKCEITIRNRKTCQSCRFQKCMTTGMNPSWVLSEDQRKKRFKKYREGGGEGEEGQELSPTSQDSESETAMAGLGQQNLDRNGNSSPGSQRRRVKSAHELTRQQSLPGLAGHAPSHAPGRYSRNNRHSGPPHPGANNALAAICVPVIKTEKEQFEMSPLRDDCFNNIDLQGDSHKYLTDETAAIKIEPDMDCLDFCLNESLEGLMGSYPFENETDVKPDIKSHEKDFSPTAVVSSAASTPTSTATSRGLVRQQPQHQQPTAVPTGICLQLSEEDMMYIYKIEMSFENSNNSIPVMSNETSEIWEFISKSCNLMSISQSFTGNLLTEAVEFSLRRNLIFLQENPDFTALSLADRKTLYNRNMASMCHVRAVMHHRNRQEAGAGEGGNNQALIAIGNGNNGEQFEISYKNARTGKVRRWNLMELPLTPSELNLVKSYSNTQTDNGYKNCQNNLNPDCQKKSLLNLAESLWSLELERTSYLILLLIVLFSSQGGQVDNLKDVDRYQNQYMMLLYRYLQAKHGQEKVHQYLSKIMTFVLNLLTNSY